MQKIVSVCPSVWDGLKLDCQQSALSYYVILNLADLKHSTA